MLTSRTYGIVAEVSDSEQFIERISVESLYFALMKRESDSYHENQPVVRQGSLPHGTIELDDVDRRIMKLLRHDARLSYAHVARTVGLSEPTVRKRIDRLVHAGAIINAARINPAPIGFPIDAMIGISVVRGRVKEVGRKLAQMENVAYVAYVAGNFDIIIEAFLPHTEGLFKFLNEDLEKIDGIASTQTWNVLRTEKFFYNWEGEDVGLEPSRAEAERAPTRTKPTPDQKGALMDGPTCATCPWWSRFPEKVEFRWSRGPRRAAAGDPDAERQGRVPRVPAAAGARVPGHRPGRLVRPASRAQAPRRHRVTPAG